jgi:pyrroloquinoline quinone (PQQ) biosynthesis protein C
MKEHCQQKEFAHGIHAIVAAELAATMYCRSALASYEKYFLVHASEYEPELINNGLEWLRLHAKTHTRHAILMKRMLDDIGESSSSEIPESAQAILEAVLMLWECPQLEPIA